MGLHLYELTKRYVGPDGSVVPVIDVPRFDLVDGEQVALVGGSGTGKTTLLHLIAGILTPDSGRIIYDGLNGSPARAAAAAVAAGAGAGSTSSSVLDYRPASAREAGIDIARMSESQRDVFRGRHVGYVFQTHHLLPGF